MAISALDVYYETAGNRRDMFRVLVTDMTARVSGWPFDFTVRDISPRGVGLVAAGFEVGQPVLLSLYQRDDILAVDLIARVARVEKDVTGLYFENLERRQVDVVHAIALHIQKEQLEREKFQPFFIH